ncbi:MAG: carboxylating nicotinate-nucleotide diphosphorylase [Ignavibacteriaceae bacterium]
MLIITDDIIKNALQEDIKSGDITSLATISADINATGKFLVKQDGIIAGLEITEKCFKLYDADLTFTANKKDGDPVTSGEIAAEVNGKAISILSVERTALNFLQRMSGIATAADLYQEKVKHTKAKIIDTRKTVPGLRMFDKLAVKLGGCSNHRIGLYDMFLIKDNHIAVAGSITKAVAACKEFRTKKNLDYKIEVETKNLAEVEEALATDVDVIMLDNFNTSDMKKAVELINGKCAVEASGGVDFSTVKEIAETGVDFISVGALTHSVKALDISLDIET